MEKVEYEPYPRHEIPFGGIQMMRGLLVNKRGTKVVSILAMDLNPSLHHVLVLDFNVTSKYTPRPEWLSNEELFRKYNITFDGGKTLEIIGKIKTK